MTAVREITCRTIVNKTGGYLRGFTHTVNPYRGCSYGGTLCGLPDYAPEIARAFGERRVWGRYLDVKVNAPQAYVADHRRIRRRPGGAMRIYMSSVTDPYVPQEKRYRVTRGILEAMEEHPPDRLALQTHTPNVLWDEDLIVRLAAAFGISVQISVETDRESFGHGLPGHAYPIAERIEALRLFRSRGVRSVAVVSPMWPIEDPGRFATRLERAADFVVLDHYLLGDGSKEGSRTRNRIVPGGVTFPEMLARLGYEEWNRLEAFERVKTVFLDTMGPERVGISSEGFLGAAGMGEREVRCGRSE